MVLLTASQVSVAVSSTIVILCTAALFFSGYAIQQRTLRDLRKAIRPGPRPSPKIYLPDRFKQQTTELEDGTVVEIDNGGASSGGEAPTDEIVVEVRPTIPEEKSVQQPMAVIGEERRNEADDDVKQAIQDQAADTKAEKPLSRAERRRKIKQEIMELSQGESPVYYQRRLW
ncbi:hypothetical protein BX600DRAFT_437511 [Xylariales sp. PMI_506]|nr:hypothetical protein BX600DRAFT_437511 [Xylariales sp. PMI_506]